MSVGRAFQVLYWALYPVVIFFGLQVLEPRYVAALLALLLVLRRRRDASRFLAGISRVEIAVISCLLALVALTTATNSELLLRLYPAAMSFGTFLVFGASLLHPPSMVERFARLREPGLPPEGVAYARRVTQVWCVFLGINGLAALYTALVSSRETWALYNGFVAYLLMGALFAGEWLVRRRFIARHA
jgi:uncharacterized membrane protein